MPEVIAIAVADIHLSHTAPVARSPELDWYKAQARMLSQLSYLQTEHAVPLLIAGDLYDRWNAPAELINFAIEWLGGVLAIPGQHDMPYHSIHELRKSAYWTLMKSSKGDLSGYLGDRVVIENGVAVVGFPWGEEVEPYADYQECSGLENAPSIALIHQYAWTKRIGGYPGAPKEQLVHQMEDVLDGYTFAIFGDNHTPFVAKVGDCTVVNCGCLIPRKIDERKIKPAAWLLCDDGTVEPHYLDTSEDLWMETANTIISEQLEGFATFLDELGATESDRLDYRDALERYMEHNKVGGGVKQELINAMGDGDD